VADLVSVNGSDTNEQLTRMMVRRSAACPGWMQQFGARFQPSLRGTLHLGRTNVFFLGGGKALMNSYYAAARRLGVTVLYESEVVGITLDCEQHRTVHIVTNGEQTQVRAKAVVIASGGFESNFDWLRDIWGPAADNFIIRGTRYNTGKLLQLMLDSGAEPVGSAHQCHAVAVDARAPKYDGGIVTRLDCVNDTRFGGRWSLNSQTRSHMPSWTERQSVSSCRRCFRRSRPTPFRSWRHNSNCRRTG
jgi:tricarballylate dehydrogenase